MNSKQRVDIALVERGMVESRQKAQALIMAGKVYLGETKVEKSSEKVLPQDALRVKESLHPYVGRGALKLEKALHVFQVDVSGAIALDIGAATGGFTDVLLQSGAKHVYAIDVGYGQLDWKIRSDARVTVMERTNARYLKQNQFEQIPTITVMDVSFISVKLLLPVAAALMGGKGRFYILIKPQFEAGRAQVGKKGVVRDANVHREVIHSVVGFVPGFGYHVTGLSFSPIKGPEGNIEYLAEILPLEDGASLQEGTVETVVQEAHAALSDFG